MAGWLISLALFVPAVVVGGWLCWSATLRIDERPYCRRCRYDVSTQLERGDDSPQCPECGQDLQRPRATNRGQRVVLWWRRLTGVGLLLLATAILAAHIAGRINWYRYMPDALLGFLVRNSTAQDSTIAFRLLDLRNTAGDFTDAELIDVALDMYARGLDEPNWPTPYNKFLGNAVTAGRADAQQIQRMMDTLAAGIVVRARSQVQQNDVLPVSVRVRRGLPFQLRPMLSFDDVEFAGTSLDWDRNIGITSVPGFEWPQSLGVIRQEPGRYTFSLVVRAELRNLPGLAVVIGRTPVLELPVEVKKHVPIRPVERTPELDAHAEGWLGVHSLLSEGGNLTCWMLKNEEPPVGLAYQVYADFGRGWERTQGFTNRSREINVLTTPNIQLPRAPNGNYLDPDTVDLLFFPSPAKARQTLYLTEIYSAALLYRDVPRIPWATAKRLPRDEQRPVPMEVLGPREALQLIDDPEAEAAVRELEAARDDAAATSD